MELSQIKKPSTYKLQTKNVSLIFNPESTVKANAVLLETPIEDFKAADDDQKVFQTPGEYEIQDTMVEGISTDNATSYVVERDGVRLVHLAHTDLDLTDAQIEKLTPVDVLMVPCNNGAANNVSKALSVLEPRIIVPLEASDQTLNALASELGTKPESVTKLKINRRDLPQDNQQLVVING